MPANYMVQLPGGKVFGLHLIIQGSATGLEASQKFNSQSPLDNK